MALAVSFYSYIFISNCTSNSISIQMCNRIEQWHEFENQFLRAPLQRHAGPFAQIKKKNTIKQNVNTKYNSTDSRQHKLYYHHVAFVNLILLMCFFAHRCGWPRSALLMGQQCSQMFWIIWHEWRFINDFISERISASSRTHAQLSDQQSLQFEDLRVRISLLLFITTDDVAEFMNTIHS